MDSLAVLWLINTIFILITANTLISTQSSSFIVFKLYLVYFYLLLYKSVCCRYLFELPQQVQAIKMSTNNICFHKENQKKYCISIIKYSSHEVIFLSVFIVLIRWIFYITKTRLYNFKPLKPHFYIAKLGFTGVYIIFLISTQKHRLWVLVRTASARRF